MCIRDRQEEILSKDQAAVFLGNATREIIFTAAGAKIPAFGQLLGGWNFARSGVALACDPSTHTKLGFAVNGILLLATLRGVPTSMDLPALERGGVSWAQGGVCLLYTSRCV